MFNPIDFMRRSLAPKIILAMALTLLLCCGILSYFTIQYQKRHATQELTSGADRLSTTIMLGAHYAMLNNSRAEIAQIVRNVSKQKEILAIRIYNKEGVIKFSSRPEEVEQAVTSSNEVCSVCHKRSPPRTALTPEQRSRVTTADGKRVLAYLSPIRNEAACSSDACHVHPPDRSVLGVLDVVLDLEDTERAFLDYQRHILGLAIAAFLLTSTGYYFFLSRFLTQPLRRLASGARCIGKGMPFPPLAIQQNDEIGELAMAIDTMARDIAAKQAEIHRQRDEYQQLFAQVPCSITVQDRSYRLLRYNREFEEKFKPVPGDFCYHAYKGRSEKCEHCPVEKTFATGLPQISEESGYNKDGSPAHWIVRSSPVIGPDGDIEAAMEMSLDITARKVLEDKLKRAEKKYHAIFRNIPNAVFVLDKDSLDIIDCNQTVEALYGYAGHQLIGTSFLDLFDPSERDQYASQLRAFTVINQARNLARDGAPFYVDIRLAVSEHDPGREVLLVSASDITKRLETERKLIQAGKMATLGEMATGVAHELNQPLTVIKTASRFFVKKIDRGQSIAADVLRTMACEIDTAVDRATKIINHLREFGRKSDLSVERVQPNAVLRKAFDLFSKQLVLRQIEVVWDLDPDLPEIMAEPNRLEQVCINLLLNARDAIEEQAEKDPVAPRRITLTTRRHESMVAIEVADTGPGVPPPLRGRIFEPFYTTKKVGKGTGLGLSISYGLIKDFGGTIQVANAPGGGAAFVISLPAVKDQDV